MIQTGENGLKMTQIEPICPILASQYYPYNHQHHFDIIIDNNYMQNQKNRMNQTGKYG